MILQVEYLCVEIQKGDNPSKDFTLMYQTSPENFYDCVPIMCESKYKHNTLHVLYNSLCTVLPIDATANTIFLHRGRTFTRKRPKLFQSPYKYTGSRE